MNNDFLSQEEIDALLNGSNSRTEVLEEEDKDLLGEIGNICMGSAATTLSMIINQPVSITTPTVKLASLGQLREAFEVPNISIEVKFTKGLIGGNLLVLEVRDAGIIADLMMGGKGSFDGSGLSEIQMSAVSEAMNQMIGTAATSMAQMFNKEVNISPPEGFLWDNRSQKLSDTIKDDDPLVQVSFRLTVGSMIDSQIMQLLPFDTAKGIVKLMTEGFKETKPPVNENKRHEPEKRSEKVEEIPVQRAEFSAFEKPEPVGRPRNIDLILDVPIEVSAILGRTRKTIKEILELNNGSLIELDKLVEEPVEILVNGKMVAQGEVVVVNENFGVRITNIVSNAERVKGLKGE
jgi:flagellar motor switch protein FliN/FliY